MAPNIFTEPKRKLNKFDIISLFCSDICRNPISPGFPGTIPVLWVLKDVLGKKTGAENIVKEIKQYQKKWLQHIQRMDTNRIPKQALQYKPKGRRHIGRPRKRWGDQFYFEDTRNRNQT